MKVLRALLALIWLIFGLTATAHAGTMMAPEPACHMAAADMAKMPKDSKPHHTDQSLMPCCSQPVIVAAAEMQASIPAPLKAASPQPALARPMSGTLIPYEPRPPKLG